MTVYILEGVDETGKTTLANQLQDKHGFYKPDMSWLRIPAYDKRGMWYDDPTNRRAEWERLLVCSRLLVELSKDRNIVLDRFYASQYVYGTQLLLKGIADSYVDHISVNLARARTKTLLLTPDEKSIDDSGFTKRQLIRTDKRFEKFLRTQFQIHGTNLSYARITARPDVDEVLKHVG